MKKQVLILMLSAGTSFAAPAADITDRWYQVIRNDDRAGLGELIQAGVDVKDKAGATPLMYSAAVGSAEAMKTLIKAGADVNAKNEFGVTALMWCATDLDKVRLLVGHGADVNARSKQGRTPLLIAAGTQGNGAIVRLLLDKGAELKTADADPVTTPLTAAADADDMDIFSLLLEHGAEVHGPAGGLALASAAAHGDVAMMKLLLARGVPADMPTPPEISQPVKHGPIALGNLTALHFAAPYGGPDAVKLLLDNKANVNAQDVRGMTPLMLALAVDHGDVRVVRLLLEHGADVKIRSKAGETALDWARKFNRPEMLKALNIKAAGSAVSLSESTPPVSEALQKSARLLQSKAGGFFTESGCPSCHAQNLTSVALSGSNISGANDKERALQTKTAWAALAPRLLQRMDAPGGPNMVAYSLLQMAADGVKPDAATDAMVHNIAAQQQVNGNWHIDGIARPPMADGDFTHTALAIRSLVLYAPAGRKAEMTDRVNRAMAWLRAAKPETAEDRNMQLLGLVWGGAERSVTEACAKGVRSAQFADGGWAQTPYLASDAYATGQTLAALREAGVAPSDPAYRKGVEFLLRTQAADGSWHVVSRSPKFQPYFESGFPYAHDQWISMAGTAWATAALRP